jgi:hypothetical protein
VSSFELQKVHEALGDPDWVNAMQEELECFTCNKVWSLVERPNDKGIDNRARQLSTPEARLARPNCNNSRNTSSYHMSIL